MSSSQLGFLGRVAVVTGAGGGLGRQYALEFAKRGASVVVNDLGGTFHGEGQGTQLADQVVKEIKDSGGKAVANYDSVENGHKIIESAIQNFGKVDILVNNAGILRDRSFAKLSEEDWDKVFQVHVKGAFKVTKAAWPHMRKQKYGRIVMTTSPAGLYGNFGQSNYSAAKMALVGFANTLSKEGFKSNIHVNTIAPIALTRMTEGIMPLQSYPEHICPFVVYLCHDSCLENGSIIETAAGYAWKTKFQQSQGLQLRQHVSDVPSVEGVANNWDKLTDFTYTESRGAIDGIMKGIMESVEDLPEHPIPENASAYEKITSHYVPPSKNMYTVEDAIRYAYSVGATLPNNSCFLYEGHSSFSILPSFATIVGFVLHGEQYVEMFKPFPPQGSKLTCKGRFADVLDKKKFLQLIIEGEIFDEQGEKICRNQYVVLFLGKYGIGKRGKSEIQVSSVPPPRRSPDAVVEDKTSESQAALYRLNGDKNPLHIDPEFASMMGFQQPILHGLCSYGYATRHVIQTFADNDATLVKAIKGQFSKPVIPGQTLVTEMWQEGRRVHFQTKVKETNDIVIKGGFVDFNTDIKRPSQSPVSVSQQQAAPPSAPKQETGGASNSEVDTFFNELGAVLTANPQLAESIKGTFLFQIMKDSKVIGQYFIDLKSSSPTVTMGTTTQKPDVTYKISDVDFIALATEKLNPMTAFMQGKLKVNGKIMLAQKLGDVFKAYGKSKTKQESVKSQATSVTTPPPTTATQSGADKSLKATGIFTEMESRLTSFPDVIAKIKGAFLFQITKANKIAGEWFINFNSSPLSIRYGGAPTSSKPDVTIKVDDDDFALLAEAKLNPMSAFLQGKIKAKGKIMLAQKLGDLFKQHASKL